MKKLNSISDLTSKKFPLVKTFLALKWTLTDSYYFYFVCICMKLLGALIITSNFICNGENGISCKVSNIIRSITSYGLFSAGLTIEIYIATCFLLFIFILIFFLFALNFYKNLKIEEKFLGTTRGLQKIKVISFMFYILIISSGHMLEFFSFVYVIYFKSNSASNINSKSNLNNLTFNDQTGLVLIFLNSLSILSINIFFYYSFKILNEPYFISKFPIKLRYSGISVFLLIFISNLQILHFLELYMIDETSLLIFKYSLIGTINILLVIAYFKSLKKFNFDTFFSKFIYFILTYCFFSSFLEILLYLSNNVVENFTKLLYLYLCKIVVSICFVYFNNLLYHKKLTKKCKINLFKIYDQKVSVDEVESFYYILNALINLKKGNEHLLILINMIISHKSECGLDFCKCNIMKTVNNKNIKYELNFILETFFTNCNLNKEDSVNILFAEYLFSMRKSALFSYAILNTFINKKMQTVSNLTIYCFYLVGFKFVEKYEKSMKNKCLYLNIKIIFDEIKRKKTLEKNIMKSKENFENMIDFKEKIDSTMKINYLNSNLDSPVFNQSLDKLVKSCKKYHTLYKNLKSSIIKEFKDKKCKDSELSYNISLFFEFINKKIPLKILNSISNLSQLNSQYVEGYFNLLFDKYMSEKNATMSIIIEINKSYTIKYFPYKLSNILGYKYEDLIGSDMHTIIPEELREAHKKVLLDYFLIKRQPYFTNKTFAISKNKTVIPVDFTSSILPNLSKNLQAIVSFKLLDKKNFYFIVSEKFELIGMSENFESVYSINNELVEKSKIDMLKLFNLSEIIPNKFISQLEAMSKNKAEQKFQSLYSLSNYVFNMYIGEENNKDPDAHDYNEEQIVKVSKQVKSMRHNSTNIKYFTHDKKTIMSSISEKENFNEISEKTSTNQALTNNENFRSIVPFHSSILKVNNKTTISGNEQMENSNLSRISMIKKNIRKKKIDFGNTLVIKNYFPSSNSIVENFKDESELNLIDKNKENIFKVLRDKNTVISYLEKYRQLTNDMEMDQKNFNKLCEAIRLMRGSLKTRNYHNIENKIPNNYRTVKNDNKIYNDYLKIKTGIRKINDTPFYVISIKEKNTPKIINPFLRNDFTLNQSDNSNSRESANFGHFANLPNTQNRISEKFNKETMNAVSSQRTKQKNVTGKEFLKTPSDKNSMIRNINILKEINTSYGTVNTTTTDYKNTEENKNKNSCNKKTKITNIVKFKTPIIIIFPLLISIILRAYIAYLYDFTIKVDKNLFFNTYWSNFQDSSLTFLYSSCIFLVMNLSKVIKMDTTYLTDINFEIQLHDIQNLISERITIFRDNYARLYDSIQSSSFKIDELQKFLFSQNLFLDKTLITWENIQYNDSISSVMDYISSNTQSLSSEENFEGIVYDIDNAILFKQYEKTDVIQKSKYAKILYFLNRNVPVKLKTYFTDFELHTHEILDLFKYEWKNISFTMECISIGLSLVLLIIVYYNLMQFDKFIFDLILSMFLNLNKGKDFPYKSYSETSTIRNKLNNLKNLINCFSPDNIVKMNDALNLNTEKSGARECSKCEIFENKTFMKIKNINNGIKDFNKKSGFYKVPSEKENNNVNNQVITSNANVNTNSHLNAYSTVNNNSANSNVTKRSNNSSLFSINSRNLIKNPSIPNINLSPTTSSNHTGKNILIRKTKTTTEETLSQDIEVEKTITNGQVLELTKRHHINLIKISKLIIIIIFLIYILFIVFSVVIINFQSTKVEENTEICNNLVIRFPLLAHIFNLLRLMILENDFSYSSYIDNYMMKHEEVDVDFTLFLNKYESFMSQAHDFSVKVNSNDYELRNDIICNNPNINSSSAYICSLLLKKENRFNQEGTNIAFDSGIQIITNIYKDYIKYSDVKNLQSETNLYLKSKEILKQYFNIEDFANVNMEIEFVIFPLHVQFMNLISLDMTDLFDFFLNLNKILCVISIILNFLIIFYLIFGFFRILKIHITCISFSAKKFNLALFET